LNAVQAQVEVKTLLSHGLDTAQTLHVAAVVRDAKGRTVFSVSNPVPLAAGTSPQTLVQQVQILNPHLWNGRADPYLYTVAVRVFRGDKMVDEVEQPLGLRTVAITSDGFLLNGKPYPIHGVDRHQDMAGKAWALLPADHQRDLQWLLGMGVTAIRLAHYPQSEYFHDLCDRAGILLWNEVPFVNEVPHPNESPDQPSADTIAFDANLEQQMHEMILQRYNHPAASFWGLFNEISPASAKVALPELKRLNDLAHQLDPSRPTVAASNHVNLPINLVPDHTAFNLYPGWYEPAYADPADHKLAQEIDVRYAELSDRRIGISEYGAGGNPAQHADDPLTQPPANKGQVHPEEWQAYVHERDWAQIKNNPKVWGTFVWVMFDFASSRRNEGDNPGVNDKGLVTQDRQIAKDAYYFYQANWTTQPMVYLTSRRFTPRQNAVTDVKVYSNCPQVELLVNGHSAGVQKPDDICIARWSGIQLQPGNNTITAIGHGAASTPQDSCTWTLAAAPAATATP
jgi:beta-galactosidase